MRQLGHDKVRLIWEILLLLNLIDVVGTHYIVQHLNGGTDGENNLIAMWVWQTFGFNTVVAMKFTLWTLVFFITEYLYRKQTTWFFFVVALALVIMLFANVMSMFYLGQYWSTIT